MFVFTKMCGDLASSWACIVFQKGYYGPFVVDRIKFQFRSCLQVLVVHSSTGPAGENSQTILVD